METAMMPNSRRHNGTVLYCGPTYDIFRLLQTKSLFSTPCCSNQFSSDVNLTPSYSCYASLLFGLCKQINVTSLQSCFCQFLCFNLLLVEEVVE